MNVVELSSCVLEKLNKMYSLQFFNSVGPIPRINNSNFVSNADRNQRMQPIDSMPYNDTTNKAHVNNSNNSIDVENKDAHKHKNARSPNKSSSSKSGSKSGSSNSGSSKSKSSSSVKNSSSKSERSSRSSSSSSMSKKSKSRKDDKSPRKFFHFYICFILTEMH